MADVGESLDFWALLDEVADDTVNRLVYEMGPTTVSCAFGDGDTVDILSICDPSSLSDSVAGVVVADDTRKHVQLNMEEVSTEKRCDKLVLPAAGPLSTEQSPHLSLQLKPSANSRFIIGADQGQKSLPQRRQLPQRRSRWQFSKLQRQQLDAAFKENMYPSKWRITELSRTLGVPAHTLRNRRWRLRKRQGISGDLHTRGSRTMLPDKGNITTETAQCQPTTACSSELPAPSSSSGRQTIHTTETSPHPVKPACTVAKSSNISVSATTTTTSFITSAASTLLNLLSVPRPVYGMAGRAAIMGYNWGMSSLMTGWNLHPPFCWPTGALHLPSYPFLYQISPRQSQNLPTLLQTYSSDLNVPHLAKTDHPDGNKSEVSGLQVGSAPQSYINPFEDRLEPNWSLPSTYHYYGKSSNLLPPSYPVPSAFIHPVRASTLDPLDAPIGSSVASPQSDKAPTITSTLSPSADAKLATQEDQTSESHPSFSSPPTFFSSIIKSTEYSGVASSSVSKFASCTSSKLKVMSYSSPAKSVAMSATTVQQSACPYGVFQSSVTIPTWSGLASHPRSAYPAESLLQPPYPATIYPAMSGLATPFIPPSVHTLNGEVQSGVAPAAENCREMYTAVQQKPEELQLREEELEAEGDQLEVLDVTTVTQSREEDVSSTSDETK